MMTNNIHDRVSDNFFLKALRRNKASRCRLKVPSILNIQGSIYDCKKRRTDKIN
jgi:hypothetical protein